MQLSFAALDDLGLPAARAAARRLLCNADQEALGLCASRDLTVPGAEGPLRARLYEPEGVATPSAGLVFFHGGGFVVCDLETHDALCRRLAHAGRLRILSVDYRLAPEAPCPAQHQDALASAAWAFEHAAELGMDPRRIGLAGDSAGAHLALWTAPRLRARGAPPRLLALLYPLVGMEDAEWAGNPVKDLRGIGRLAVAYIRKALGSEDARAAVAISDSDLAGLPPVLLVGGGPDPVRPDGLRLAERLTAAGVPVQALAYPGLIHGGLNLTHLHEIPRRALRETGEAAAALLA
jgi:acetyl esterase